MAHKQKVGNVNTMFKKLSILFLFLPVIVCGQYFPQPQTVTMGTPYCYRGGNTDKIQELPEDPGFFRVSKYGVKGDSITDDTDSITAVIALASAYYNSTGKKTTVYFKQGDYLTSAFNFPFYPDINLRGKSKNVTNIIYSGGFWATTEPCNTSRIAIWGFKIRDQWLSGKSIKFESCKFMMPDRYANGSMYFHIWGMYQNVAKVTYSKCDFWYDSIYMALYAYNKGVDTLLVDNCTFTGNWSSHPVRMDMVKKAVIYKNTVRGGITGIFVGSNRQTALSNISITYNTVYGQLEEGIAFDGFGNETGRCPVIGQGSIVSASNTPGKTIIKVDLQCRQGTHPADTSAPLPLDYKYTWTNFYFCFDTNTTYEGRYYKITAFDSINNTVTIDTAITAATIGLGTCSIDAGFFNNTVAYNEVYDVWGVDSAYGTGLSFWLNSFNADVHDNYVHDCAHGANISGGLMLNLYRTKSWRNNIHDNVFDNLPEYGVQMVTYYDPTQSQYDNIFKNNTLKGASFLHQNQVRFTNTGNTITP